MHNHICNTFGRAQYTYGQSVERLCEGGAGELEEGGGTLRGLVVAEHHTERVRKEDGDGDAIVWRQLHLPCVDSSVLGGCTT